MIDERFTRNKANLDSTIVVERRDWRERPLQTPGEAWQTLVRAMRGERCSVCAKPIDPERHDFKTTDGGGHAHRACGA
jgi:hypothetical protein